MIRRSLFLIDAYHICSLSQSLDSLNLLAILFAYLLETINFKNTRLQNLRKYLLLKIII